MLAYIFRRLLLIIPTLFGIMVLNFVIVQAAPGGPVEQIIAQVQGLSVEATARVSGGAGGETGGGTAKRKASTVARRDWTRNLSPRSKSSLASTSRRTNASG